MKAAGQRQRSLRGGAIALGIIAIAVALSIYTERRISSHPSTDDATIDADVVHVAAAVGGRIIKMGVAENDVVSAGDLLFQIDPLPYQLALAQAEADLGIARAALETQRRILSTQRANAAIAADQTVRARTNGELAARTVDRLSPLASQGYVTTQMLDQAQVAERDAKTSLQQAQRQQEAAQRAIDTEDAAAATVRAREAAVAIARRALDDTTVRAPHNGRIVGLSVLSGEMVVPGQSLFTLISTDEWYAVANFRETELRSLAVGECVTAYSMIDRGQPIRGVVQGIGSGVFDEERINIPHSVPYVERSVNWVRVAQRFPVRIRLEKPPPELMRLGASAVVEVKHGRGCR